MAQQVVTKKSFIGGRIVLPGEMVDVDAKGELVAAPSSPVGNLTVEQLEAVLAARKSAAPKAGEEVPVYGRNIADPDAENTGTQEVAMANVRPGDGSRPQVIPAGATEHLGSFVRPAPAGAPAAVEVVVGAAADGSAETGDTRLVGLTGKSKAELLDIAKAESVDVNDNDTNDAIRKAIEAKRSDA